MFLSTFLARGAIVLNENFNYPDGSIIGAPGSLWNVHSGTSGDALVASAKLQISFSRTDDIDAPLSGQPFSTGSGTILYSSFTANFSALPTSGGAYFAHFNAGSNHRGVVYASTTGTPAGFFRLGTANAGTGSSASSGQLTTNLSINQNYLVVTRYNVGTGVSTLWLNPLSESDPGVTASDAPGPLITSSFSFRQTPGEGAMTIDDLRVATSFAEVISTNSNSPPIITTQPQSQTVFAGAHVSF